jgi:casein kinase 1/casein kinase 1 epsilon
MESKNENIKSLIGSDINKYTITKYISSGSFGDVFEARNKKTNELVALKIPIKTEERDGQQSLLDEARIYKNIADPKKGVANMKITTCKDKKIIVMDLLGASLESLLSRHKKFGLKTVIALAIKMIEIIRYIHSCGYLHRDIKPDNFVVGYENKQDIFCIDFGLAKRFIRKNGDHVPYSEKKKFCGTARYASIAAHNHCEQGRKDDLEAIGYILVYLYKGKLPWQGIKHKDKKERYRLIGEKKEAISEEDLCMNMPKEFVVFLKYARNLDFDEKPHYSTLKKMFIKLYESRNYKNDKLEWE